MATPTRQPLSTSTRTLLALELFVGIGALGGGIGLMVSNLGYPGSWLKGTPFSSYFFPGLGLVMLALSLPLVRRGAVVTSRR